MTGPARQIALRRIDYEPAGWETIVTRYPEADVYHGAAWLAYLAASHHAEPVVAEVRSEGVVVGHFVGATVRRFGMRILGSPLSGWGTQVMGFLLEDESDRAAASDALLTFAYRELGCAHVELGDRVLLAEQLVGSRYEVTQDALSVVDVAGSDEEILGQARSRTRSYMRRGAKNGLSGELARGVGFADEYYDQLVDVFGSSGLTPTYGVERVRQLISALEPTAEVTMVRLVDADGNRIGTCIAVGRGDRAVLWGLAFYRQYGKLHPVEALQWETMKFLRARNYRSYNLAGDSPSKAKFSSATEDVVRMHHSRYPILDHGRNAVQRAFYLRQRLAGRVGQLRRDPDARDIANPGA